MSYVLIMLKKVRDYEIPTRVFGPWKSQEDMEYFSQGTILCGGGGSYKIPENNIYRFTGWDLVDPMVLKEILEKS